jgi:hypothetical protein
VKVSKQPFQGLSDEGFPAFHYLLKQTNAKMIQVEGLLCKSFCLENCKRYLKKRKLIAFRLSVCVHVTRSNLIFGLINLSFIQVLVFFASYRTTTNSSCVTLDNFSTPKNTTHALAKNNYFCFMFGFNVY